MDAIRLCYELAYLEKRAARGMKLSSVEKVRFTALWAHLARDPEHHRRDYCRFKVNRAASISVHGLDLDAKLMDISASGCLLASVAVARPGTQLKISVECAECTYVFVGRVTRLKVKGDDVRLAVAFDGIPLQLRRFRRRPPSALEMLDTEPALACA